MIPYKSLLLLFCLSMSCNSPIVDLPEIRQRLVLNGVVEPESPYNDIRLTMSQGILDEPIFSIQNVSVSIFENDQLRETVTKPLVDPTDASFPIPNVVFTPGNMYRVEATTQSYGAVTATYIQPLPVTIDSLAVTILGPSLIFESSIEVMIRVYFEDPPGANFYFITARMQAEDGTSTCCAAPLILSFVDPSYAEESIEQFQSEFGNYDLSFTDVKFDGQRKYFDFKSHYGTQPPELGFYAVTLKTLTKEYYEYLVAVQLQQTTRDDPFAQPVYVKGNVENGYGIFSGITQTIKVVEVK